MATTTKKTKKQAEKVLDAVVALKPHTVIEEIGALQNSLQNTLAGLSAQISTKIEQMRNVEEAIKLKEEELAELYEIDAEAISIEEIRNQHDELNAEWEKKQTERLATWEEDEEERAKRWQREEEEHTYDVVQKKKRDIEEYNVQVATRNRLESIRQEDLQKQWASREETLVAKEQELKDLKTQVAGFEDKLRTEISKAEAIAVNRVKKDFEHEIVILKKDVEAERALNSTKVSAMNDTIEGLEEQITNLQNQLVLARADAKEVTNAALNSASGRQTLEAIQKANDNSQSTAKSGK